MEESKLGKVEVSPTAIAGLAAVAVLECYGVVGMASKDLATGIVESLQPGSHRRGVDVHVASDQIVIDLYVVIQYGTRITMVAHNIQTGVKYTLEKALGIHVAAVNVHVQAIRVSPES
jgi:uncharacterized alkaline shock family protein YloU